MHDAWYIFIVGFLADVVVQEIGRWACFRRESDRQQRCPTLCSLHCCQRVSVCLLCHVHEWNDGVCRVITYLCYCASLVFSLLVFLVSSQLVSHLVVASGSPECLLALTHRETYLSRIKRWIVQNLQILIVSAVRICKQCLQTASASVCVYVSAGYPAGMER